ncbi:unnamed protein product [Phyllotreta striolata]|uniref:Glycoside hydrolase family 31 n=1 Tax=Phyllotreta striolata TaxID=444603 RepID=A0A9N9TKC9_PHYSR|nr:unnamed protein product [Phyllotreta striolata]
MASIKGARICLLAVFAVTAASSLTIRNDDINLDLNATSDGIIVKATKGNTATLTGKLGVSKDFSKVTCIGDTLCEINGFNLSMYGVDSGFYIRWQSNESYTFEDCFELEGDVQWYGGPEKDMQYWPLQKMNISGDLPYVSSKLHNAAVAERYWLNSKGTYIYLTSRVPLYVDQNVANKNQVCFKSALDGPYIWRNYNILEYYIIVKSDPKEAHLHAVTNHLGKPKGHPNEKMIREPIWTTWAKYKRDISDKTVISFAQDIRNQGYKNGQIEIDDSWERCYGAQEFSSDTFPDIGNTVRTLKNMDFRVTLWVHPFVNTGCNEVEAVGLSKNYFVYNMDGNATSAWWDGTSSHQIDFTDAEAAEWWKSRLEKLQKHPGIDSFKCDAGEIDWSPTPSKFVHTNPYESPNILTERYIRTCATLGDLVEVRSAYKTQDLQIFLRMLDKDSSWGIYNGLYTLITTLLQLNMNGYTMILPDMIGGNGYGGKIPDAELLVRWTQANTFMPAMQFSYLPWEITSDKFNASDIVHKFVDLHEKYSQKIIDAMTQSIEKGTPVNPPIWWIDPTDATALACDDEYLLGEDILVAPVIVQGAVSRSVYLPKGEWTDGNDNTKTYKGPTTLTYNADISTLPYFILKT